MSSTTLSSLVIPKKFLVFPSSSSTAGLSPDALLITSKLPLRSTAYVSIGRSSVSCTCSATSSVSSSSTTVAEKEEEERAEKKIGAKVRVKVPLKVYHVPRVPEVDLTGKEGNVKQYVGLWKGKRISANYPYKIEFVVDIEGRGPVKFFTHLREDEFEYLD